MDKQAIFHNLTAWFARSVSSRRRTLWSKHGGRIVNIPDAQFIFSQDIEDRDTKCLFKTEDYLIGCLTVFDASFIDACLKNQSAHKTLLSKFLLLPKDSPKVLHCSLIPGDKSLADNPRGSSTSSAKTQAARSSVGRTPVAARQDARTGEPLSEEGNDANSHRTGSGDRLASAPTGRRMADEHDVQHEPAVSKVQRRNKGENAERTSDARDCLASRQFRDTRKMGLTAAPKVGNTDVSKIPHVKDLPKVSGSILDFVIGKDGCVVQKIENM